MAEADAAVGRGPEPRVVRAAMALLVAQRLDVLLGDGRSRRGSCTMPAIPHMTRQDSSPHAAGERASGPRGLGYTPRVHTRNGVRSILLALTGPADRRRDRVVSRSHRPRARRGDARGAPRAGRPRAPARATAGRRPAARCAGSSTSPAAARRASCWQTWRSHRRHRHDLRAASIWWASRARCCSRSPASAAALRHLRPRHRARDGPQRKPRARAARSAPPARQLASSPPRALRAAIPERADRMRVVPLCIDPERIRSGSGRRAQRPAEREPAALLVGRMWSEERGKGHDALIEGWPEVLPPRAGRAALDRGRGRRRRAAAGPGARARRRGRRAFPRARLRRRARRRSTGARRSSRCRAARRASAWSTRRRCGTGCPASARRRTPPAR